MDRAVRENEDRSKWFVVTIVPGLRDDAVRRWAGLGI